MSYLPKDYVVNYYSKDFSIEAEKQTAALYDVVIKDNEGNELKRIKNIFQGGLTTIIDQYRWEMLINPSTINMPYPGQQNKPRQAKKRRKIRF